MAKTLATGDLKNGVFLVKDGTTYELGLELRSMDGWAKRMLKHSADTEELLSLKPQSIRLNKAWWNLDWLKKPKLRKKCAQECSSENDVLTSDH